MTPSPRPRTDACLLAFDYGTRRIGVAVGQGLTGTASPLRIVRVHNLRPDWDSISALIADWQPAALVVGLPLHADGSDSHSTQAVRRFIRQLEGRYRLPVYAIDETLSSHAAAERTDGALDAVAAQIILETWFAHYV